MHEVGFMAACRVISNSKGLCIDKGIHDVDVIIYCIAEASWTCIVSVGFSLV